VPATRELVEGETLPENNSVPEESGFNVAVFNEVLDLLGPVRTCKLLRRFDQELDARIGADMKGRTPGEFAGHAHALASQAGFLGFVALRERCLAVEAICMEEPEKADFAVLLSGLMRQRDAVRGPLLQLEASLVNGSP
jgi:HPt (histidine-containing phosphotransfer) domain-containing protein